MVAEREDLVSSSNWGIIYFSWPNFEINHDAELKRRNLSRHEPKAAAMHRVRKKDVETSRVDEKKRKRKQESINSKFFVKRILMDGNLLGMTTLVEQFNIAPAPIDKWTSNRRTIDKRRTNDGPFLGKDGIYVYCIRFYFISAYYYLAWKYTL